MDTNMIAVDLGAESGRVILGSVIDRKLTIDEIHRFPNTPVKLNDGLHWDILRLWRDIIIGLSAAVLKSNKQIASVGVDTWGVDFGLLDKNGSLISNPFHYRDSRTDGMIEKAFSIMPKEQIFQQTGIQFMQLNSLFQLLAMVEQNSPQLDIAETFLTIPDLINYWLTGKQTSEFSIATTTQCYDPIHSAWAGKVLDAMGIPKRIFPKIIPPTTNLGPLRTEIVGNLDYGFDVIAPACHDTGSAVAAVPAESDDYAWISSGTWSIMGINLPSPIITPLSLENNFTNEGGVGGTFRFSKNIMGLWLVQECRRTWQQQGHDYSYSELTSIAEKAQPHLAIIDVDHTDFLKPGDMPSRIQDFCKQSNQEIPTDHATIIRIILESIALKYRWVLEKLEIQTGRKIETIHIIGGGTQNKLLNQFTADATQKKIITGPVEATAIGNILTQATSLGLISTLEDTREIVLNSFDSEGYFPANPNLWDEEYEKLKDLIA